MKQVPERQATRWGRIVLVAVVALAAIGAAVYYIFTARGGRVEDPADAPPPAELAKQTRFIMGTYVTMYAGGPRQKALEAIDLAMGRMEEVDRKFNPHDASSPLYAYNTTGTPISDPEVIELLKIALQVSRDSGGAFDVTIYPVTELWGFSTDTPKLPTPEQIAERLAKVDYRQIVITDGTLTSDGSGVGIELGGIAKGYAVGQGAKVLKEQGITSAIIDAGGDVYAIGKRDGRPWKVGIRHPRKEGILGYVEVEDKAVMGSGDYERFFIQDGKRYHHIIDPKTGYPASELTSVTVIHSDPVTADAWATALFVMGPDEGLAKADATPGMAAIVVTAGGDIKASSGLDEQLKHLPEAGIGD
jgi:thiamine biosynthesis lipoprotein